MRFFSRAYLSGAARLIIAILLLMPTVGEAQIDFRDFVEKIRTEGDAVLYNECSSEAGKTLLLIILGPKTDVGFFEVQHGWLIEGTRVLIKGNEFEFVDPPGGQFTRARIRRFVEELLKGPFEFLTPNQIERLNSSVPKRKCPSFEPDDPVLRTPNLNR